MSGKARDEIAENNGIGAGTARNIINEWKNGVESTEYESVRELAIFSKEEGVTLSDVVSHVRLNNYIKKLGANFEQIERALITRCAILIQVSTSGVIARHYQNLVNTVHKPLEWIVLAVFLRSRTNQNL